MALMEKIRAGTDSTFMKVVFGAIVLVFVFWGVTPQGNRGQLIAEVNGEQVSDTQLRRALQNMDGTSDMDADELNNLEREIIAQILRQRVLIQEAERLGLVVSVEEIAREIRQYQAFQTEDGKFSAELYASVLKHSGLSKGLFEEQRREAILLQKLNQLAATSVQVTDGQVQRAFEAAFTDVALSWVRIDDDALLEYVEVSDADVQEWVSTHPQELKESYDRDFNTRWSKPRRADVSVILLRTDLDQGRLPEEELKAVLASVREQALGGADFATLARRFSEDLGSVEQGGRLGLQTEAQLGEDLAKAIKEAGVGGVTDVVRVARGLQIAMVHEIKEPEVVPMEEAQAEIARARIAEGQVRDFGAKVAEDLRTAWTDPDNPPQSILDQYGLKAVPTGPFKPAQPKLIGLGSSPQLEAAIAGVDATGVMPAVYDLSGGRVVAAVTSYSAADPAMLETMQPLIMGSLLQRQREAFMERYAEDLVARANIKQHYNP